MNKEQIFNLSTFGILVLLYLAYSKNYCNDTLSCTFTTLIPIVGILLQLRLLYNHESNYKLLEILLRAGYFILISVQALGMLPGLASASGAPGQSNAVSVMFLNGPNSIKHAIIIGVFRKIDVFVFLKTP